MMSIQVPVCISLFYLSSSAIILLVYLIPRLNSRFLVYGARETHASVKKGPGRSDQNWLGDSGQRISKLLDFLTGIRVPHSWFLHFYLLSVGSSTVWLYQFLKPGGIIRCIAIYSPRTKPPMTVSQLSLCWTLMSLQGSRRLYECVILSKPSRSTMWIGHYAIGLAFYLVTGLAVCVQGVGLLHSSPDFTSGFSLSELSLPCYIFVPLFLMASYVQHKEHVYLASLKKYTLPTEGLFSFLITPHYTAECIIYLCLAILGAPSSHSFNLETPLVWAFLFVVINLGVSADMTRAWTAAKFGAEAVQGKWRMIWGIW